MLQKFDERNRDLLVNINGRLVHRDQAGISPFDSAVQGGDAVWEGLRIYEGRIFKLREHLDHLRPLGRCVGVRPDPDTRSDHRGGPPDARGQQHVRRRPRPPDAPPRREGHQRNGPKAQPESGSTLIVLAEHKPPSMGPAGVTLITSSVRRFPQPIVSIRRSTTAT